MNSQARKKDALLALLYVVILLLMVWVVSVEKQRECAKGLSVKYECK